MESEKILSRDEIFLKKITEAVLNNLENEQFGVTELSDAVAISRFQLHRKLKLLKGKSVSQFIRELRLSEAMKMLRADAGTTSEISYRVGFTSPSYFNKCFHDFYGYSPGEVKKRNSDLQSTDQVQIQQPAEPHEPVPQPITRARRRSVRNVLFIVAPVILIALFFLYLFFRPKQEQISIAILPLDDLTGYPEQAYFVNGMHDALIGELGQVSALRVISRTSTLRYPKSEMLLQDIARELGVDVIVEGSVYGTGDSIRIQLQMIEAFPQERHIWAKEYHSDIQHALAMHSSVVRDIASEIRVTLTPDEEKLLAKTRTVNPETYRAYLMGMHQLNQFTPESVDKGMAYLLDAVRNDPGDPLLWAALSMGYNTLGHSQSPPPDAYSNAKAAAARALALDETLADTHLALALIALYRDWDWEVARKEFDRALEINPNLADAHSHFAWFKFLFGQMEEGLKHAKKATELDPFSALHVSYLAAELWWTDQYEKALPEVDKSLRLIPDYGFALFVKGGIYSSKGMHDEAIEVRAKAHDLHVDWRWTLGHSYAVAGRHEEARKIAEEIKTDPHPIDTWGLAEIYAALGDKDEAFHWLEEGYKVRFSWIPWIASNPNYESLRDDPRFEDLLKRLDLPALREHIANR
jgi:TolB-like protein/AraC-like DNA-binding protein